MIGQRKFYYPICDCCKKEPVVSFESEQEVIRYLNSINWLIINEFQFCPDCYETSVDLNEENICIKVFITSKNEDQKKKIAKSL